MNIKRIIAREGLFALILLCGAIFLQVSVIYYSKIDSILKVGGDYRATEIMFGKAMSEWGEYSRLYWRIGISLVSLYSICLIIRFIIWALRTLREGK